MHGLRTAESLLLLLLFAYPAYSQDTKPPEILSGPRSDLVPVVFTVTDKQGAFAKDLQANRFKILDNNLPQEIAKFEAQTERPLRLGLLIDASNAIQDRFAFEQQAASAFLEQVLRPATDKAFVLSFDEVPDTVQDFTNEQDRLAAGIKSIRPGSGTAIWDAVYYACRDKMMREKNSTPVRRAMVLIADNSDDQSRVHLAEAIQMAMLAEVIVYAIDLIPDGMQNGGDRDLHMLAEQTGGRVFLPSRPSDLTQAFNQIQEELRSQYIISYKPDNFKINGEFRTIRIIVDDPKLKVRARKGYYAPKQ